MSADNILITLKSPRRDGEGFEWYVLDVSFSGYDCKVWDGGLSDELILAINDAYLRRDFYTEDDAEGFAEKYHDENIVEYGGTQHETNFPFPTAGEILAAQRRWEADRLRRECAEQVTRLQSVIRYLVEFEIKYAGTTLDHFRECLHNPEFESWYETIRERDIPEAEDKLVDLCFQLVAARRELEVAEHELAAFGEITIKIRTEQITLAGFVGKTIAVLRQHLLDLGRVQLPRSDYQVIFVGGNQVHADFILVEGNVIEFCMKHGVMASDGSACCAFVLEDQVK